jgi:hypothetical protein
MHDHVKERFEWNNSRIKIMKLGRECPVEIISHYRSSLLIGCMEEP